MRARFHCTCCFIFLSAVTYNILPLNTMQNKVTIVLARFLISVQLRATGFVGRGDTSFAVFAICSLSVKYCNRPRRAAGGGKKPYLACGMSGLRQHGHSQAPADSGVEVRVSAPLRSLSRRCCGYPTDLQRRNWPWQGAARPGTLLIGK